MIPHPLNRGYPNRPLQGVEGRAEPQRPEAMPGERDQHENARYFDYFMVRSQQRDGSPPRTLSGVIERLGTGEKRPFRTTGELLRLMEGWSGVAPGNDGSEEGDEGG